LDDLKGVKALKNRLGLNKKKDRDIAEMMQQMRNRPNPNLSTSQRPTASNTKTRKSKVEMKVESIKICAVNV
jgi:hypothetical protein